MKIVELLNNVKLPISNEEYDILGKFNEVKEIRKKDLSPREQYLVNGLVNKDILIRKKNDGQTYYRKNSRT